MTLCALTSAPTYTYRWGGRPIVNSTRTPIPPCKSSAQASEYVAIVTLVSAIEALSVPNAPWEGKAKVARFIDFVLQVAPETLAKYSLIANFPVTWIGGIARIKP